MKITGFNPSILTSKPDDVIRLFEDIGFKIRHNDKAAEGIAGGDVRMEYADFRLDITTVESFTKDKNLMRMNVDDFEEAYKILQGHGFCNALGDGVIIESEHFTGAHMAAPSGFEIMVMQHKKKQK
jgi:hypothetical protein